MSNTATPTEHSAELTSASEFHFEAYDAVATEHTELSADVVEHYTSAPPLPPPLGVVHTTGTATEHTGSALTTGTTTEHSRTVADQSARRQVAAQLFAVQRQVRWAHVAREMWEHRGLAIGLDGASGGFQGLVMEGDVVYVIGEGSLQMIDYFHAQTIESHLGVTAPVPWYQMGNKECNPSYMLVSQKGRFAHSLVIIQQAFRTNDSGGHWKRCACCPRLAPTL